MVISVSLVRKGYTVNRNLRIRKLRIVTTVLITLLQIIGFIANNFSIVNMVFIALELSILALIILHSK
jgi:hypothetical protein